MTLAPPDNAPTRRAAAGRPSAFTLVELMISIALVVVLILGINQVFKYTSDAVGAGEAVNSGVRDGRAVQTTFANDFAGILPNGGSPTDAPFITIRSAATPAFVDAKDLASDRDGNPLSVDINGNGLEGETTVPGEVISPATYNSRNHRLDTLGFFARGSFPRQTGNDGTFVANMTSPEAYVHYGHLWLPDNSGNFGDPTTAGTAGVVSTYPGALDNTGKPNPATNPNNAFASQFVLGRVAMLLRPTVPAGAGGTAVVYDNSTSPTSQVYTLAIADPGGAGWSCPLFATPTAANSAKYSSTSSKVVTVTGTQTSLLTLNQSRFDLAGMSMQQVGASLAGYYAGPPVKASIYSDTWWQYLMGMGVRSSSVATATESRFQCNPFVAKPLTAAGMAQATPYFLKGCSQFIVEFAGDFVQQENNTAYSVSGNGDPAYKSATVLYGDTVAAGTDGQLDYTLVPPTTGSTVSRTLWRKQVRWYGMPRSTAGLTTITAKNGDVVPLRDWIENEALITKSANPATFEKTVPAYLTDYASVSAPMATGQAYTCAFGRNDPAPQLIRITVTVADPTGRLPDGQTYQYVFAVPRQ